MRRSVAAFMLIACAGGAIAQDRQAETGQPPQRIRNVTVSGQESCPSSTPDEVVVCSRLENPYRIPKGLRDDKPIPAQNQSWVNRTAAVEQVGRVAAGLPDTCSPIGTGGQSGCALQTNQAFAAERRANAAAVRTVPGGE